MDNILTTHYGVKLFEALSLLTDHFQKEGLSQYFEEPEVIQWVNSRLVEHAPPKENTNYANVGLNSGAEVTIQETDDPFASLRPERSL